LKKSYENKIPTEHREFSKKPAEIDSIDKMFEYFKTFMKVELVNETGSPIL
jgi:hypothetical protein